MVVAEANDCPSARSALGECTGAAVQSDQSPNPRPRLVVKETVQDISGWPTDTLSIDYDRRSDGLGPYPQTVILFVPGNPGCVGWYKKMLVALVERLGIGFAARGVSYAGHGVGENIVGDGMAKLVDRPDCGRRNPRIPWTVDGQVEHKVSC